ncbi:MAG TPA: histidine phosphatase family protein [Candidatus Binataceae bacterium]|nr:histidine phosphatase family protein [Candidatus Binataceae bacterium]
MSEKLPALYLARHGETAWSLSGQHTGRTDLPLTDKGRENGSRLGERLKGLQFAMVLSSPLQRARVTCEIAGFGAQAQLDPNLYEWDYGQYEGRRTVDIIKERPDWQLFRDGCPGGETLAQVAARADQVVARVRKTAGDVLIFSSAHILRVLTARWLGMDPAAAASFMLSTASVSILTYEHDLTDPAVKLWNDNSHVR